MVTRAQGPSRPWTPQVERAAEGVPLEGGGGEPDLHLQLPEGHRVPAESAPRPRRIEKGQGIILITIMVYRA